MGTRVIIIGAGFGGLGAARALREQGIDDITILERADSVGGVWRDNTYPGAACDVPSPLYSWSWAINPSLGAPLLGTARDPRLPALGRRARGTAGPGPHRSRGGLLPARRGDRSMATAGHPRDGVRGRRRDLGRRPALQPGDPRRSRAPRRSRGPAFHSAEWRHDVDLAGKRVAVVGTGASAIQFVPGIVDEVGSMTVFQRSAPYVVPKPDQEYRPYHHRAFAALPERADRGAPLGLLAHRAAQQRARPATRRSPGRSWPPCGAAWKLQLRRQVPDAALRRKLQPDYEIGCKRMLFSNDWYPALARDHVDVVTDQISAIEPSGIRTADGRLFEADVIIWGTGFAATQFLAPMEITGSRRRRPAPAVVGRCPGTPGRGRSRLPQPVPRSTAPTPTSAAARSSG